MGLLTANTAWGMGHLHAARPEDYPSVAPFRFNDGVASYVVNLNGLRRSPDQDYSDEQIVHLEDAIARAFDTWNDVLAPLGLRFLRLPKWAPRDLSVITFDYERLIPAEWRFDSLAGAHSLPIFGLFFSPVPIIFDNTEVFADLADEPVVVDRPLAHPHEQFLDSQVVDIYSVALHEIGHILGLAHPSESFSNDESYNFLALESVRIDPYCLKPSEFLCGKNLAFRRPLLRTEIDSIMRIPVQVGVRYTDVTPADRAFVAFALRYFNPEGADEILADARRRFLLTSPLRFANVFDENEKDPPTRIDNNTIDHAMPIEPNSIILGSIVVAENGDGEPEKDVDVYAFEVTEQTAGATWYFDIDQGGGLIGAAWVDLSLEVCDAAGRTLARNDDAHAVDPGSLSMVDPFLTHVFQVPDTYYVVVTSSPEKEETDAVGDYELRIGIGSVPEPTGEREVIPALIDPSVADCLGTAPVDTSAVPCQTFGILAAVVLALMVLPSRRRTAPPQQPSG